MIKSNNLNITYIKALTNSLPFSNPAVFGTHDCYHTAIQMDSYLMLGANLPLTKDAKFYLPIKIVAGAVIDLLPVIFHA